MRDRLLRAVMVLVAAAMALIALGRPAAHNYAMIGAARALMTTQPVGAQELDQVGDRLQAISGEGSADYALGMIYFQRADLPAAVDSFRRSRTPAPCEIALSLRLRANQWAGEDRLPEAERAYRVVLDLCPGTIEDRLALARVLNAEGALPEAVAVLAEAAALVPETDALHFEALGQMYLWRHQWSQALSAYRQASALQPEPNPSPQGCLKCRDSP